MGTIIRATGVSNIKSGSAIEHAVDAAKNCIESSGAGCDEIGLMINAGVYRDKNLCEPSIASLIQQKLGLNLDPVFAGTSSTFSFDQRNGAAGFISSCNTADAWLAAGDVRYALVVASDCHPSGRLEPGDDFPFTQAGSAALLEKSGASGFSCFSFLPDGEVLEGVSGYFNINTQGGKGRENLALVIPQAYSENLLEAVCRSVVQTAAECSLDLSRCCIISSQPEAGFSGRIAAKLGIDPASVVDIYSRYGHLHSAATGAGFDILLPDRSACGRDFVICVAPGAGMGIASAVYCL